MKDRRGFLQSVVPFAVTVSCPGPAAGTFEQLTEKAASLAADMARRGGGRWKVSIDTDFILIAKQVMPDLQEPAGRG